MAPKKSKLTPRLRDFIEDCEEYCLIAGIAKLATLSTRMLNRGLTLDQIKLGERGLTAKAERRARRFMEKVPPEQYKNRFKPGRPKLREDQKRIPHERRTEYDI